MFPIRGSSPYLILANSFSLWLLLNVPFIAALEASKSTMRLGDSQITIGRCHDFVCRAKYTVSEHMKADAVQRLRQSFFHNTDDADNRFLMRRDHARFGIDDVVDHIEQDGVFEIPILSRPWHDDHSEQISISNDILLAPFGPDISDRPTVVNLAKMTSDAYVKAPTEPDWMNTTLGFNHSSTFGWEKDGLRGHVFTDHWNKTVILSLKGTTIDPREKWTEHDRLNDNVLFSCCCGDQRPDPYPYRPVCGCRSDTYTCNATCITQELVQKDRYYTAALKVMLNVTATFPDSDFWVVGHCECFSKPNSV